MHGDSHRSHICTGSDSGDSVRSVHVHHTVWPCTLVRLHVQKPQTALMCMARQSMLNDYAMRACSIGSHRLTIVVLRHLCCICTLWAFSLPTMMSAAFSAAIYACMNRALHCTTRAGQWATRVTRHGCTPPPHAYTRATVKTQRDIEVGRERIIFWGAFRFALLRR